MTRLLKAQDTTTPARAGDQREPGRMGTYGKRTDAVLITVRSLRFAPYLNYFIVTVERIGIIIIMVFIT